LYFVSRLLTLTKDNFLRRWWICHHCLWLLLYLSLIIHCFLGKYKP